MLDTQLPSGTHLSIFNAFPPRPATLAMLLLSLSRHSPPSQLSGYPSDERQFWKGPHEAVRKKKKNDGRCNAFPWITPTIHRARTQLPPSAGRLLKEERSLPVASRPCLEPITHLYPHFTSPSLTLLPSPIGIGCGIRGGQLMVG